MELILVTSKRVESTSLRLVMVGDEILQSRSRAERFGQIERTPESVPERLLVPRLRDDLEASNRSCSRARWLMEPAASCASVASPGGERPTERSWSGSEFGGAPRASHTPQVGLPRPIAQRRWDRGLRPPSSFSRPRRSRRTSSCEPIAST